MKTIGFFKIGDRVQATSKEDGTQHGVVVSMRKPEEPKGTEQEIYCCVEWDNEFTNAKISISLDSRILEGMNGNNTITYSPITKKTIKESGWKRLINKYKLW